MMHLSRWSEELFSGPHRSSASSISRPFLYWLIHYAAEENPDVPELVRGKTGRVYGALISLLTLMKSQPLAYNKDNQEDKEPLFDTVRTLQDCLRAFVDMLPISSPIERPCATLRSRVRYGDRSCRLSRETGRSLSRCTPHRRQTRWHCDRKTSGPC